ncbi:aminotransferase class I/II-fold pyridoxal phosphate-dependent enzyme [uncultured Clostridium sp.]|uniref:threonine aldolase family protein n=1 Tax=uncultured Clostridium sp. TaxID=59620 RepID=UPI0025D11108|nr:aminotransferase class I/II-fold pyridoxal phosphate-dependent enzyme [uncultured Clostridium sp.]
MYSFKNDYSEGAHPRILDALLRSNMEQEEGYGLDRYSKEAIKLLKEKIMNKEVDIHLLQGGTQTNLIAISAFLKPYEAAIAANTGHILVHETGAIEATGHKVISVPSADGKINSKDIEKVLNEHVDEHMVKPKLVYISNPTEIGTIYKKEELKELSETCKKNNLILYVDGARLGSALMSESNNMSLSDLATFTDAFYIGATKNGGLMGEALIICNENLKNDFRFSIKQRGGLVAKGRVLGIQFLELFKDNLYFELANHANKMSSIIKESIDECKLDVLITSDTNQLFPIVPNSVLAELEKKYKFTLWERLDEENTVIRIVTSWATKEEKVIELANDFRNLVK